MTLFHFDCFAVVTIERDEPEDRFPDIRGLFANLADAADFIRNAELERKANHEAYAEDRFRKYGFRTPDMTPMFYAVVPLSQVKGKSLSDLEDAIEKAAILQMDGIGVLA